MLGMRSMLTAASAGLLIAAWGGCGGASRLASSTQTGPGTSTSVSASTSANTRTRQSATTSTHGSKLFVPGRHSPPGTYDPAQRLRSILRHLTPAELHQLERRARSLRAALRACRRGVSATGPQLVSCLRRHGL